MCVVSRRFLQQAARHPQVDQERAARREADDQVLAAPVDVLDALAGQLRGDGERVLGPRQPDVADLDVLERPPLERRRDRTPDGLDLGELRHRAGRREEGRVDDAAAQRRVVRAERAHHPGRVGDLRVGALEAELGRRHEAELRVVGRDALDEHERLAALVRGGERGLDERAPHALPLAVGPDGHRRQDQHVDVRPLEPHPAQHRVRDDLALLLDDEGELGDVAGRGADLLRERRRLAVAEGGVDHAGDLGFVLVALAADHQATTSSRMSCSRGGSSPSSYASSDRLHRLRPARLVARVHLGEDVALGDARAALGVADDADGVVDLVALGAAAGAEMERGDADVDRAEPRHGARVASARDGEHDRRPRQHVRIGVAALRADPALVDGERRAVRDGSLRAAPPLLDVDAEIGQGEQPGARVEHELGEVRRPLARARCRAPRRSRARCRRRRRAAGPCR